MIQKMCFLTVLALFCGAGCQTQNSTPDANLKANPVDVNLSNSKTENSLASPNPNVAAGWTIDFSAPDGVKIVGTFYAATQENSPAVLMLHQFGSNRASYKKLAEQFQASGIAVLTIDGRGFGESTKHADGSRIAPSQSNEAVAGMKSNVAAAIKFLSEQKNIDKARIGITGASYGSSLAIIYAAENPDIKAVALLSPGTNYFGNLPTSPAIEKYGARPVLVAAAEDDSESANDSRQLDKLAAGKPHILQIYPNGGHGTGIFNADVGLDKLLLDFFRQNL